MGASTFRTYSPNVTVAWADVAGRGESGRSRHRRKANGGVDPVGGDHQVSDLVEVGGREAKARRPTGARGLTTPRMRWGWPRSRAASSARPSIRPRRIRERGEPADDRGRLDPPRSRGRRRGTRRRAARRPPRGRGRRRSSGPRPSPCAAHARRSRGRRTLRAESPSSQGPVANTPTSTSAPGLLQERRRLPARSQTRGTGACSGRQEGGAGWRIEGQRQPAIVPAASALARSRATRREWPRCTPSKLPTATKAPRNRSRDLPEAVNRDHRSQVLRPLAVPVSSGPVLPRPSLSPSRAVLGSIPPLRSASTGAAADTISHDGSRVRGRRADLGLGYSNES